MVNWIVVISTVIDRNFLRWIQVEYLWINWYLPCMDKVNRTKFEQKSLLKILAYIYIFFNNNVFYALLQIHMYTHFLFLSCMNILAHNWNFSTDRFFIPSIAYTYIRADRFCFSIAYARNVKRIILNIYT